MKNFRCLGQSYSDLSSFNFLGGVLKTTEMKLSVGHNLFYFMVYRSQNTIVFAVNGRSRTSFCGEKRVSGRGGKKYGKEKGDIFLNTN